MPKFITSREAADKFGITQRYINRLCSEGRVKGAAQFGTAWMIPDNYEWTAKKRTSKPRDRGGK